MTSVSPVVRILCAALAGLMVGTSVGAAPAQLPLMVKDGSQGKPNIVFTFDDSGSMSWPFMPDSERNFANDPVMHPWDSLPLNAGRRCVVRSDGDLQVSNMRLRSPQINTLYYNPAVRYVPWGNAAGGNFANSPPAAASIDPLNIVAPALTSTTRTVNLKAVGLSTAKFLGDSFHALRLE
jgi:type IV pilus assembly protein PilY1